MQSEALARRTCPVAAIINRAAAPAEPASPWIGRTVGGYRLTAELGAGGMGMVFAGVRATGERAAVKILHRAMCADEEAALRFLREARTARAIRHPHIAEVRDVGRTEAGDLYLVMELLEGRSLGHLLEARRPLAERDAARIGAQLADALTLVHGAGTVHRDLKPQNVFLCDRDRTAKLLDFGVAKVAGSEATATGTILGTPYYMAPEQARSSRSADARADVYSLGVMLYEMATGRVPFAGATLIDVLVQHASRAPEPPSRLAKVSAELESIILRCLAKDPAARPAMAEVRSRLVQLAGGRARRGVQLPRGAPEQMWSGSAATVISRPAARRLWPWVVSAGAVSAIGAAVGYALLH